MKVERVVLDTNMLISAILSPLGKPYGCLRWALDDATFIAFSIGPASHRPQSAFGMPAFFNVMLAQMGDLILLSTMNRQPLIGLCQIS